MGGVDGGGVWAAGGRLYPSLGLFRLAMSPESASHRPKNMPGRPKRCLTTTGSISDPCLPCSSLHGSYCLSCDFT